MMGIDALEPPLDARPRRCRRQEEAQPAGISLYDEIRQSARAVYSRASFTAAIKDGELLAPLPRAPPADIYRPADVARRLAETLSPRHGKATPLRLRFSTWLPAFIAHHYFALTARRSLCHRHHARGLSRRRHAFILHYYRALSRQAYASARLMTARCLRPAVGDFARSSAPGRVDAYATRHLRSFGEISLHTLLMRYDMPSSPAAFAMTD